MQEGSGVQQGIELERKRGYRGEERRRRGREAAMFEESC